MGKLGPLDHIQTPMGCNKEGILGAGKRILTHNNIVFYVFKTTSDYKYDISDRHYDSASV